MSIGAVLGVPRNPPSRCDTVLFLRDPPPMSMITLDMDRPYISLLEMTKIQLSCFLLAISLVGIHTMYVCIVFGRNKPYVLHRVCFYRICQFDQLFFQVTDMAARIQTLEKRLANLSKH